MYFIPLYPPRNSTPLRNCAYRLCPILSHIVICSNRLVNFRFLGGTRVITILLVVLLLMAIGAFPSWGHSRSWGYYPSGGLGLVVLILLILVLLGRV
jgi:hypothetical protein